MDKKDRKREPTERQHVGALGEDIACRFLLEKGFRVLDRNYRKKWGEIDIVAEKEKILHFVEVKTVAQKKDETSFYENGVTDRYRPEDNVHPQKIARLCRAVESYLSERRRGEMSWVIDVIAISLSVGTREARVRFIENVS